MAVQAPRRYKMQECSWSTFQPGPRFVQAGYLWAIIANAGPSCRSSRRSTCVTWCDLTSSYGPGYRFSLRPSVCLSSFELLASSQVFVHLGVTLARPSLHLPTMIEGKTVGTCRLRLNLTVHPLSFGKWSLYHRRMHMTPRSQ